MPARILPHIQYLRRTFTYSMIPAFPLVRSGTGVRIGEKKNRYEEGSARRIRHSQAVPEGHPPRRDWAWDASTIPTMPPASGHRLFCSTQYRESVAHHTVQRRDFMYST